MKPGDKCYKVTDNLGRGWSVLEGVVVEAGGEIVVVTRTGSEWWHVEPVVQVWNRWLPTPAEAIDYTIRDFAYRFGTEFRDKIAAELESLRPTPGGT